MSESSKKLLIVSYSQSGDTAALAQALEAGARDEAISGVTVKHSSALDAEAGDVLEAGAIILATPENFGYMSGAMKYFFDRIYYPCLEHTQGLGYALVIKAGNDGQGARHAVERIVTGLSWRELAPPMVIRGELPPDALIQCEELGLTVAAGLEAGIF